MESTASTKVLVVIGSAREESNLRQLAHIAGAAAASAGAEVRTIDLHQLRLPVMVWGDPAQASLHGVREVREAAAWADAFILGTPEYHGSMSGALKNWFDFLYEELAGKVAGVVATTGGGTGDMSITAVKTSFSWCHGFALPFHAAAPEAAFVDGALHEPRIVDRVERIGHDVVRYGRVIGNAFELARGSSGPGAGPASGVAGLHRRK